MKFRNTTLKFCHIRKKRSEDFEQRTKLAETKIKYLTQDDFHSWMKKSENFPYETFQRKHFRLYKQSRSTAQSLTKTKIINICDVKFFHYWKNTLLRMQQFSNEKTNRASSEIKMKTQRSNTDHRSNIHNIKCSIEKKKHM